ncbi:hypothetical protein RC83_09540 [Pectobacterium brasiliense]|nr:hypothetical protein RC83_20510 [Pectobacterium brasiliense]KHS87591.1 hypothetical protein RC83_09540 [Pectobacterium brasiliense]
MIGIDLYIPAQCVIRVLYRIDILDFYLFKTLNEARDVTEHRLTEYNSERPHESLKNLMSEEYGLMVEKNGSRKKCVGIKRVSLHLMWFALA